MGFFVLAAVLAGPAVLMGVLAHTENLRTGQLRRVRQLCGGSLFPAVLRALGNSIWSMWLTALALPFAGFASQGASAHTRGHATPPVLYVHGLYHNPAAWFVLRRRLARAGFTAWRTYGYSSFGPSFMEIAAGLAHSIRAAAAESADGTVLLVGHSLGGLIIRAAVAQAGLESCVRGIVTLGTPHQGSTLAGMLAVGRLGRGLKPGGEILRHLAALPPCRARALSLYTPTDAMVLPLSGALLLPGDKAAGWRETCLPALSHVGLLYNKKAAALATAFLQECLRETPRQETAN